EEEQQLLSSFLIKVTDFFRDERAFGYLRDNVLPTLAESARRRGEGIRIWSAGCSTGEEAYSIAILVAEQARRDDQPLSARIFATDLDADAMSYARRGIYPANALKNVPPELLSRYFINVAGEYEVERRRHDMMQL